MLALNEITTDAIKGRGVCDLREDTPEGTSETAHATIQSPKFRREK